ncbi:hypothetical protein FB382_003097 [Nocardioides ginsengisegetis]|uniref:Uncharacterized protein n=1 Tax=Nocardioides ginsengisegetis TaxID=661491 RepID=A0A7W3PAS3_9ACTN|nr:hypothetical protein [Nocardioides ginsengisegetis]MBA8804806.1 hypothetical protein [Nocardioides ginsengisegetis]
MSQKQNHEDLDAPTPPGGPQRTDAPGGTETPGRTTVGTPSAPSSSGSAPDDELPPPVDRKQQTEERRDLQEENAETSLDQPSQ